MRVGNMIMKLRMDSATFDDQYDASLELEHDLYLNTELERGRERDLVSATYGANWFLESDAPLSEGRYGYDLI